MVLTRGETRLISAEAIEDQGKFIDSLSTLRASLAVAKDRESWYRVWDYVEYLRRTLQTRRCLQCREHFESVLRLPLQRLETSWHDMSRWDSAVEGVQVMVRDQLDDPSSHTRVPIDQLRLSCRDVG